MGVCANRSLELRKPGGGLLLQPEVTCIGQGPPHSLPWQGPASMGLRRAVSLRSMPACLHVRLDARALV